MSIPATESSAQRAAGEARQPAPSGRCANCGAALSGRYCGECGQSDEHAVHSFWHFAREAAEDATHADSRLWRTLLPLLFRPGFLTREFLDGRRMSYLPPVRLYLVLSVLFFLTAATLPPQGTRSVHVQALATVGRSPVPLQPPGAPAAGGAALQAAHAAQVCAHLPYGGPWRDRLGPRLEASCVGLVVDGGRSFRKALEQNAGRAMFLILPLLGLVMKALYRKPPRYYVEHLLFFVHNHSCLFLVLSLYAPVAAFGSAPLKRAVHLALVIYIPVYFYLSMRRVYSQGRLLTGAKLAALSCAYLILGTLMATATVLYSLFTP